MQKREGVWADVREGMYVLDSQGKTWRVHHYAAGDVWLIDRLKKTARISRPRGRKPVTILEPTEREAFETLKKLLGVRPVA
jgi:hypothetical protein